MSEITNQPTYKRQRFLLAFLHQLGSGATQTDLQKLVFLNTVVGDSDYYEFIPYKFGPYSFQLKEDVDVLKRDGFVTRDNACVEAIGDHPKVHSFQIVRERGDALIRKTYRDYPYYALNSEITDRLFSGEELELFNSNKGTYKKKGEILFTIGYEGRSIESFINTLIVNDVRLLCDVRKNPLSRKFGFSKHRLVRITQAVGIKYIHMPDLGIESGKRRSLNTSDDYKYLFDDYRKTLSSKQKSLDEVFSLLKENTRIALMCFEQNPEMCHRHIIRDYIIKISRVDSEDI